MKILLVSVGLTELFEFLSLMLPPKLLANRVVTASVKMKYCWYS